MGRRRNERRESSQSDASDERKETKGKRQPRRSNGKQVADIDKHETGTTPSARGFFGEVVPITAVTLADVSSVALKCHNGKHIKAEIDGDLKATSSVVKDQEKFDITHHDDGKVSLRSYHGKYVYVDKNGDMKASSSEIDNESKFEVVKHESGLISLKSHHRGYVAAEMNGRMRANRSIIGAWERFQLKDRSQKRANQQQGGAHSSESNAQGTRDVTPQVEAAFFFDSCCQLESVLSAEERYARTHTDRTAFTFEKRVRARRRNGQELSFKHFRQENQYPIFFRGCLSAWDVTAILCSHELESLDSSDWCAPRQRASSSSGSETFEPRSRLNSAGSDNSRLDKTDARLNWMTVLEDQAEGLEIVAAFGIPALSAAEAQESDFERLTVLCKTSTCKAIGPVGLDCSDPPVMPEGIVTERYDCMSAAEIEAEFGVGPTAVYEASKDPACISRGDTWMLRHADRRQTEFMAAKTSYVIRKQSVQLAVAEKQLKMAKQMNLPVILQIPPQEKAERCLAELLVTVFGEGSGHPLLLSAFQGRPKCAAALLKYFPKLMVGFSGLLTHNKLKALLGEVAFDVPMDRFVLESLGPNYPPSGDDGVGNTRGSYSHPLHVTIVAKELAKVKKLPEEEVLAAAFTNSGRLFGLFGNACRAETPDPNPAQASVSVGGYPVADEPVPDQTVR
eukprot:TRINITY_DN28174_c0_g1_i1.p1 TRINITY_DN28174_c0_g1~~TRINITY_DN28174_c0_g1_i1.p1  ORF type:complete len:690 (+),score=119.36 TRINITY_DN28174_c0_g1_i1:34-2070(+)